MTVGRVSLVVAAVLGLLAAGLLVITDDSRWLRLGVVAALWSAMVGAFALARCRRELLGQTDRSDELRRVYELELEREVAARREYELEVETVTRRRIEHEVRNEARGELDGLRTEMRTMRQNLEALLGGEVLVERVALRAESTRLRSLSDQSRAARSAQPALPRGRDSVTDTEHTSEWTPDLGRAFAAEAEVLSARIEPTDTGRWARPDPAAGRGYQANGGDRTDILPAYRPKPTARRPDTSRRESRAEPPGRGAAPDPVRPEPWPRVPARRGPARPGPAQHEPARPDPVGPDPARPDPVRPDPVRQEPARRDPIRRDSVRQEPVRREPVRQEQVRQEQVRQEQVRQEQVRHEPPQQVGPEPGRQDRQRAWGEQTVSWQAGGLPRPERTHQDLGPSDTWTRGLRPLRNDQPAQHDYEERPAAQQREHRTGPHRIPPEAAGRTTDRHAGPPSDPLGVDPLLAAQWAGREPGRRASAVESFDSWVSANQASRRAGTADPAGSSRRNPLDDTGSYIVSDISGGRRYLPEVQQSEDVSGGRRRAPDSTGTQGAARSVDDLIASLGDQAEPRRRHRREA